MCGFSALPLHWLRKLCQGDGGLCPCLLARGDRSASCPCPQHPLPLTGEGFLQALGGCGPALLGSKAQGWQCPRCRLRGGRGGGVLCRWLPATPLPHIPHPTCSRLCWGRGAGCGMLELGSSRNGAELGGRKPVAGMELEYGGRGLVASFWWWPQPGCPARALLGHLVQCHSSAALGVPPPCCAPCALLRRVGDRDSRGKPWWHLVPEASRCCRCARAVPSRVLLSVQPSAKETSPARRMRCA